MSVDRSLSPLFSPASLAHVGASERGTYPAEIFQNLLEWKGRLYPVNPSRSEIFSVPAYPSVSALPEVPELALVTVARQRVIPVVEECIACGVKAVVIISAGFAEADDYGRSLQRRLKELSSRIRIIGPNCAGLADVKNSFFMTRLFAKPRRGGVSFVSSSGALMMALFGSFTGRGIGLRYLASLGNQVDVCMEEVMDYYLDDPETTVLTAFIEGVGSGDSFVRLLQKAGRKRIPLVAVKSGRSELGSRIAATHTASLASSGRVFEEVCRQYGAILVDSPAQMLDVALLADTIGPPAGGRIGVISQSGGAASLTADLFSRYDCFSLPPIPESLELRLRRIEGIPDYARLLNPLDARGDAMRGEKIASLITAMGEGGSWDLLMLLFAKNPNREVEVQTVRGILAARKQMKLPIVVVWIGEGDGGPDASQAFSMLKDSGIPLFHDPQPAVTALAALLRWSQMHKDGENCA